MKDIIDFEKLKNRTKEAVINSLVVLKKTYPSERLNAYALCTDDGIMTIFHVGCSEEWLSQQKDKEDCLFPTEWQYADGESCFDGVYNLLMERYDRQYDEGYEYKFDEIIEQCFDSLVEALIELKAESVFEQEIFLSVQSTDPSERMMKRAANAIIKLNTGSTISKWASWVNDYN